jgi:hypothetical protein
LYGDLIKYTIAKETVTHLAEVFMSLCYDPFLQDGYSYSYANVPSFFNLLTLPDRRLHVEAIFISNVLGNF